MQFSIIVPAYNVDKYLEECLESILSQSYDDYEVLLVDDGSTDNTPIICDEYAQKDDRIRVIHKLNGGLSDARNTGLELACGEYVIFLDSDDAMKSNALFDLEKKIIDKPDVIITELFNTKSMKLDDYDKELFQEPELQDKKNVISFVFQSKRYVYAAVQYICRREFLEKENLRFKIGIYHEDNDWTPRLITLANSYAFYNKLWYIRRLEREGSITNVVKPKRAIDVLNTVKRHMSSSVYAKLDIESRNCIFNDMVVSSFSNLNFYRYYDRENQGIITGLISENFEMYTYLKKAKYRVFVYIMKTLGIHNGLICLSFFNDIKVLGRRMLGR